MSMEKLQIPNKLYGREREMNTLLDSFERIGNGYGEVLLVPGSSGAGKTALVQELQKPIQDRNGFFIMGKFDQYQEFIPYFAFRQAMVDLCRELQSENSLQREKFKSDILLAIGNLGQVLIDLVPEFESFFGRQPPLENLSPQEARHRFADVFRNFLKVICMPEHPLVLFLDDWQWADSASCELLKHLQVGTSLRYLLVIVSYRDNEVNSGHKLMYTVNDLRSHSVPVELLQVKNITSNDVKKLLTDTLRPSTESIEELARVIHRKTLGNPFFVRSFFVLLFELDLIGFDPTRNSWHWSIEKINGANLPDNLVDLFVLKLSRLDLKLQNLFSLAACLGNRFDLETLSLISGQSPEDCQALLSLDQARDMILPLEVGEKNISGKVLPPPNVFMFLHDRVQQAAYSLIEPAQLPHILLKTGRLLVANSHPEQLNERLFKGVSDLNAGRHLIQDTAEKVKVLGLNLAAGRKAYAATAYSSALQFSRAAGFFLETPGFTAGLLRDHHELAMQFFRERAEYEFLDGNVIDAENFVQQAVSHARTTIEKAAALNFLIVQYTLQARYPEAIAAGRQALNVLGISLPGEGFEAARDIEIQKIRQMLETRPVSSLHELPVMSDPEMLMASKILITMGPPCYRSHQKLWSVLVPIVVNLTLHYGNIPQVGYSHTAFGGLLGWVDDDYSTARKFGALATRLMTQTFRSPSDQSVFYLMIGSSIRHWFKHLKYGVQDYTDAYEIGLRSGNLQYAAYAFGHKMYCRFFQGVPLDDMIQETQGSLNFSRIRHNQWAIDLMEGGLRVVGVLTGQRLSLDGNESESEVDFLQRVEDHQNIQVKCIYNVLKTFSFLVLGNFEDALELSDETEPIIYTVGTQGLLPWPEHVFARLMSISALYSNADETQQTRWRNELGRILERLRIWADNCPENFEHKFLLATAEMARIEGRLIEAMQVYDAAIEAAQAGDFLQWEAIANERAYSFWLESGNERLAQVYWQQAYICYSRWGATAKVDSMENAYRLYLAEHIPQGHGTGNSTEMLKRENLKVLVERQILQLRNYEVQMQQNRLQVQATTQAKELAHAMQRLRVEMAERKRTEEALRESEKLLQDSQMIGGLGSYVLEFETGTWTSSTILDGIFGIDRGYDRSMEGWTLLLHPDWRSQIARYLEEEVLTKRTGFDREYLIVRPRDKQERWVHGLGRLKFDENGVPVKMIGTIMDITERKRAHDAMQRYAAEIEQSNNELKEALNKVKTLSGMLPICASCKKIRDDRGYWSAVESYITLHSGVLFSHGICPECEEKMYEELDGLKQIT